jgi:hypothetical protein
MASTDAQIVHALYQSMYRFMVERDISRLGALLDDSFTLTHMTGLIQSKAEFLASIDSGELRYFSAIEESCPVRVVRDSASARGRSLVEASPFGMRRSTWRLQQDLDFVKRDGRWLIAASVASTY